MTIVIRKRRFGKTTELIKKAAETKGYIVCINLNECSRVFAVSKEMGLDINFPISFDEFLSKKYHGQGIKNFLIDNADMLLQELSSVPISCISMTYSSDTTQ